MPHDVNFNQMDEATRSKYKNIMEGTEYSETDIIDIEPMYRIRKEIADCQNGKSTPGGFKIILSKPLPGLLVGDYIHITTKQYGDDVHHI